ncbi:hypothetical protein XANCAGTX0491_003233 [Xanthoria calcicola]
MQHFQRLAEITASPFEKNTRTLSSEVLSVQGETRKKRFEIALAVNGYGVEIRDMRSGSIVASYPRSLATPFTFTCPPCSIKLGRANSRDARRITYCSVNEPRPKLLRISEETGKVTGYNAQPESTSFDLPESESPIVHVEALVNTNINAETPTLDILCVHQDGQISCYNEALTQKRWGPQTAFGPDGKQSGKAHVAQVSSISVSKASKTILKNRDDVLSVLHANTTDFSPNLLLLLRRHLPDSNKNEHRKLWLHIVAFKSLQADAVEVSGPRDNRVQEILAMSIPEPKVQRDKQTSFRMHPSSGCLYQGSGRNLSIYNLTALTPQLVRTIIFESRQNVVSYLRIAPDMIVTLSGNSVIVMDTTYSSCRAKYDFTMPNKSPKSFPSDAQLLAYHDPSGSAIVLSGRKLLAVDLSETTGSRAPPRKRKHNGLLIDAIGRGLVSADTRPPPSKRVAIPSLALGTLVDPHQEIAEWEQQEISLNALLEKDDHDEFDRRVSSRLDALDTHNHKNTPITCAPPRIVDYVLSKMFSIRPSNTIDHGMVQKGKDLRIDSLFGRTWQCLIRRGLISAERVKVSLRRTGRLNHDHDLKDGELIRALAEWDNSLAGLLAFLGSSCLVQVPEICQALKIVIDKFATLAAGAAQNLLSNGDVPVGLDDNSVDGMDLANTDPSSDHLHNLFDVIIARCDASPTATVIKAFKAQLSKSELQTLVILLRTKLRQDGWLSSHAEDGLNDDLKERRHKDGEISAIGKLLNCAVDSLGTAGWLLNHDSAENAAEAVETVSNMQAEISTALEGIWEANYLRALLGELLICGKDALKSQATRAQPSLDWRGIGKTALPLGLKLEQDISYRKVGAGGELQKRSRRDIGKLKSRRVPEYSFEQIAI